MVLRRDKNTAALTVKNLINLVTIPYVKSSVFSPIPSIIPACGLHGSW